jgi:tetratricopeptide (TPR) repeat protein
VLGHIAHVELTTGRGEQALKRLEQAFASVAGDEPDSDVVEIAGRLGQAHAFAGNYEQAVEPTEFTLRLAQALRLPEALGRALLNKALLARASGRPEEEFAFQRHAIRLALEHDLQEQASVAYGNLSDACFRNDRYAEAIEALAEGLALAQRSGSRNRELYALCEMTYAVAMCGRWQEALAIHAEFPEDQLRANNGLASSLSGVLEILLHRGRVADARSLLNLPTYLETVPEIQDQAIYAGARAALLYAEGSHVEALESGVAAAAHGVNLGAGQQGVKQGLVWAVEAALLLGERERADELLVSVETLPPGLRPPFLEAQAQRFRARMNDEEAGFKTAAGGFREYNFPFWLAVTELEHGEWLVAHDRPGDAESLLGEAREIFERLEATPWLERALRAGVQPAEVAS